MSDNAWDGVSPTEAARRGYIVVIQDVRGRYAFEGEWAPPRAKSPSIGSDHVIAGEMAASAGGCSMAASHWVLPS
jgi:uncharacterized protein